MTAQWIGLQGVEISLDLVQYFGVDECVYQKGKSSEIAYPANYLNKF